MREKLLRLLEYASEYSLYGIIIVIPFSNAAIESFFGLAFLFFVCRKMIKPDFGSLKSVSSLFLLFFLFFMGLSLFNSGPYIVKSLKALLLKWTEYAMIFVITLDTLSDTKRMRNCLFILLGMAFIICIDALFQLIFGADFLRQRIIISLSEKSVLQGVTSSFHHYNSLGTYLVFNLGLVLSLLIFIKNKSYKIVLFALMVLLLVCLMLTFSRGSWIGFLSILTLMLFLSPKINKLVYIFFIFIIIMVFVPGVRERAMLIFSPQGDTERFNIWQGTLLMIKEHPFLGKGLGTYMDYFQKYTGKTVIQYAHNCYLQIWAEAGLFALLSFISFSGSVLYQSTKIFRYNNFLSSLLLGLVCSFFGFLVQIFFDSQLYSLELSVLFWFMAGFIIAITKIDPKQAG